MLDELKQQVYEANMELPAKGLVTYTWGNVSGIDRESGLFVIKPSGVDYDKLSPEDMVVMDLDGNRVEGDLKPSSDTPTHIELYKAFKDLGGIVHTHSPWATSWAQAGRSIPCYGTTHADYIYGEIPCVRNLTKEEIEEAYEKNTGVLIADYFKNKEALSVMTLAGVLPSLALAPFAVPVSKRFGKKEIGIFGCLCSAISCFLLFFLHTKSAALYIGINILGFLGFGIFNLILWAFITDVIDDQEVRTGKREDGTIYAAYSFARKIGQAFAGGLGGYALGIIGFNSAKTIQTQEVLDGIYNIATLLPGILYLGVALSLLFLYPLNKKRVEENITALKLRREQESAG